MPNAWETIVWRGDVDRKEFEVIGHRLIDNYFHKPNYYTIDGKPVFMLYNMGNLISGLGGEKHVIEAFDWLREEAVRSGLPGLHLLGIPLRSKKPNLSGVDDPYKSLQISSLAEFGMDSATDYSFAQFANPGRDYLEILPDVQEEWRKLEKNCGVPYIPHVTIGWDNNPRFREFHDGAIMRNNTPENFEKGLLMAKEYLGISDEEGLAWGFIRGGMTSVADLFIMQMQDILELPKDARMNVPGTVGGNWQWRTDNGYRKEKFIIDKLAELTRISGRSNSKWLALYSKE